MELLSALVRVVRVIAMVAAAAFVFLLFVNEPQRPAALPDAKAEIGEAIFATRCASCHGTDGAGGFGPALANGVVVADFPNAADQEAVVANGRGAMPSFQRSLTPEQISEVVAYTRNDL